MLVDFAGESPAEGHAMLQKVMALGTGSTKYGTDWRWPDGLEPIDCFILIHTQKTHNRESSLYFQHSGALDTFLFYMEHRK